MVRKKLQLLALRSTGSAIVMAMMTLLILSCTAVGINQYLQRQVIINNDLSNQFIAEAMVKMASDGNAKFNLGKVSRVSNDEWSVELHSGKHVRVKG